MGKLFLSESAKLISPTNQEQNDQSWKCSWFFLPWQQWQRRQGHQWLQSMLSTMLGCYSVTTLQQCMHHIHPHYAGNSWAPRTSAHGVKRNPTERMKWMHWDKIFNRLYIAGTFRFNLMAFIFGSYLRSSRSVYGSVTHNSLTFDHEPEYLLCAGCGNYDGCWAWLDFHPSW